MLDVILALLLGVNLFFTIRTNRRVAAVKQAVDDVRKIVEPPRAASIVLKAGPVSEQ